MEKEDKQISQFGKMVVHPHLRATISAMTKTGVSLPVFSPNAPAPQPDFAFPQGELVASLEPPGRIDLDASHGYGHMNDFGAIAAYDESIAKFTSLEGIAYSTAHSVVLLGSECYLPAVYLTFYFYTRSKELSSQAPELRLTSDPEMESKKDYIRDRIEFLDEIIPDNTIVFIDGPLIGGDVYTIMMRSIDRFHKRNVIPLFFVKNSASNLVTDNSPQLRGLYNSDMHWSHKHLAKGQRTNLFVYRDRVNPDNAKVFCYLKAFDISPQRIEMHLETYQRYTNAVSNLMDLAYYFLIVQGNLSNPQVRPIAVAEQYARHSLGMVDIIALMRRSGLTPTMNQVRFGG